MLSSELSAQSWQPERISSTSSSRHISDSSVRPLPTQAPPSTSRQSAYEQLVQQSEPPQKPLRWKAPEQYAEAEKISAHQVFATRQGAIANRPAPGVRRASATSEAPRDYSVVFADSRPAKAFDPNPLRGQRNRSPVQTVQYQEDMPSLTIPGGAPNPGGQDLPAYGADNLGTPSLPPVNQDLQLGNPSSPLGLPPSYQGPQNLPPNEQSGMPNLLDPAPEAEVGNESRFSAPPPSSQGEETLPPPTSEQGDSSNPFLNNTAPAPEDFEETQDSGVQFPNRLEPSSISCNELRERVLSRPLSEVSLDVSPAFGEGLFTMTERRDKEEFAAKSQPRSWYDYKGEFLANGKLVDLRDDQIIVEENGLERTINVLDLSDADVAFVGKAWNVPFRCGTGDQPFHGRQFVASSFRWTAPGHSHNPLYFEQPQLERYGHSLGPVMQPLVSTAHFFSNIAILPYRMGIHPPNECQYSLGYIRPGNCAPYMLQPIPLSLRGLAAQAGAVSGGAALIP